MAEPNPVTDDEQERKRLFHDVWGDAPALRSRRAARGEGDLEVPENLALTATPAGRLDELEQDVRRLEDMVILLRRTTEQGFDELRKTMLRLAQAVEGATRKSGTRSKA